MRWELQDLLVCFSSSHKSKPSARAYNERLIVAPWNIVFRKFPILTYFVVLLYVYRIRYRRCQYYTEGKKKWLSITKVGRNILLSFIFNKSFSLWHLILPQKQCIWKLEISTYLYLKSTKSTNLWNITNI